MHNIPEPQQIYRHFKGNLYQIVTLAEHSETGELLVIYQALYGEFKRYARPLKMFQERVDKIKYPNAVQEYRFELVKLDHENKYSEKRTDENTHVESMYDKKSIEEAQAEEEVPDIDPMVLEFLDASSYEERLNILAGLHHRITDDMINVMAVATDIEVKPGDVEERYVELRNCLLTLEKFECNRLR